MTSFISRRLAALVLSGAACVPAAAHAENSDCEYRTIATLPLSYTGPGLQVTTTGSINGQAGQYGQVNYAAAKSGIHGFTKALAQEGARSQFTVNAIAPGYVDTEMVRAVPPDVLEKIVARIPMGRLGRADDIARGVAFLTADDADFITGSTLSINGGQHMY